MWKYLTDSLESSLDKCLELGLINHELDLEHSVEDMLLVLLQVVVHRIRQHHLLVHFLFVSEDDWLFDLPQILRKHLQLFSVVHFLYFTQRLKGSVTHSLTLHGFDEFACVVETQQGVSQLIEIDVGVSQQHPDLKLVVLFYALQQFICLFIHVELEQIPGLVHH